MSSTLSLVTQKIQEVVEKKHDVTFADLEQSVNASFNLIFLAIDEMVANHMISLRRVHRDYIISWVNPQTTPVLKDSCMN